MPKMTQAELIAFYTEGIVQQMQAAGWEKIVIAEKAAERAQNHQNATFLDFRCRVTPDADYEYGVIVMLHTGDARVMGGLGFTGTARDVLCNLAQTHLPPAGTPGVLTA